MKNIAFAHSVDIARLRPEVMQLMQALIARGLHATLANWQQPTDWKQYDAVFLRGCSEYFHDSDAFVTWLKQLKSLGIPTINHSETVLWNLNKRYLQMLEQNGFPIIPSRFYSQGSHLNLASQLDDAGWPQAIIKPCISAGAFETFRLSRANAAQYQSKADMILKSCDLIIQPFMEEILDEGEWSLLFAEDRLSHAVIKNAKAGDFRIQDVHGGTYQTITPPQALVDHARRALTCAPHPPLYSRVDGIMHRGEFLIMEIELIEPFLYSTVHEPIIDLLARAIASRVI